MVRRIILLGVSALLITLMMPRRAMIQLNYGIGEIWEEETLVAPFDIPIYKGPEQLAAERKALIEGFQPLFRLDTTVRPSQIRGVESTLADDIILTEPDKDHIFNVFQHIYQRGVVGEADRATYIDKVIRIDSANVLWNRLMVELFTPTTARDFVVAQEIEPEPYMKFIIPNLLYDQSLNVRLREQMLSNLSFTEGMIRSGEVLVAHGQMVDQGVARLLNSFQVEYETRLGKGNNGIVLFIGRFLLVLSILTASYIFFKFFSKKNFENKRAIIFVYVLFVIMSGLTALTGLTPVISPYIVPLPVVALLLLAFFDVRVAVVGNIIAVLLASLFVRFSFEFFVINYIGGMVAVFVARRYYQRHSIFKSVGVVFLSEAFFYCCFRWIETGSLFVHYQNIFWFVASAFLMLAFYQLVYIFERIFGFVSDITLLELSDTNQPLLLQMAEKAPGTFQHAVQVASLSESAAVEIGANPLLARAGALYHDIGKINNPYYFGENQSGDFNPHSMLTATQSAGIIRTHVTDGIELARRYRLPAVIQEFITSHHGTSKMYYFYSEEMEEHGKVEHPEDFTYPGPKPIRKEVAICMIADSVEAAARSLKKYDKASIDQLVEKIVERQVAEQQFSNAELTFAEVTRIKELFKNRLNNIYHARVAYPEPQTTDN